MLKLEKISKIYQLGDLTTNALNGVSIEFRKNEFVSVLGPSGCGKTTLLNIIGGLDKYTSGNLIIDGKPTKEFKDKDWDAYRNHRIGFVFQSYNLIPHQTVLANVELALTLSGVSRKERKQRAIEALKRVGLEDKIKNKPNQLSGGQMQRVAIARALINNPEIILADEPTGALDSESSLQVMQILKEIAKDKLIVMVTHNPELAETYSTRIVKLFDGKLISDSNPFTEIDERKEQKEKENIFQKTEKERKKEEKKKRMSFFTALTLSFKNLLTKKTRTILTAFAGSIGIIGIALILAISNGFNAYVTKIQKDTLSSYPVTVNNSSYEIISLMQIFMNDDKNKKNNELDKVYTNSELTDMLSKFNVSSSKNDTASFKTYIEGDGKDEIESLTSAIQYSYSNAKINGYFNSTLNGGVIQANPTSVFADVIAAYPLSHPLDPHSDQALRYTLLSYMFGSESSYYSNDLWSEILDNQTLIESQYELIGENSKWATEYNELMIIVDQNNEISDYTLFGLGLLNQDELEILLDKYINGQDYTSHTETFNYDDFIGLTYKLILESDYYELQSDDTYLDIRTLRTTDPELYKTKITNLYNSDKAITVTISGIMREKPTSRVHMAKSTVCYNKKLTDYVITQNNASPIIASQLASTTIDVLTNQTLASEGKTQNDILTALGYVDKSVPTSISLYPTNFEAKAKIEDFIETYNKQCVDNGEESKIITYSDTVGTLMSSVTTIISAITYVLIAFVSVSLIVSSIMIGIITYISVIERTREIGVLRSIGASKRDVKRVFTAETFIVGLTSGLMGIAITILLIIPINIILTSVTGISGIANLPVFGALILIAISVVLTLIAGLIPANIAAKKDPVLALRSE